MFGIQRTIAIQWRLRKEIVFFAGCAYFTFYANHMWFREMRYRLFQAGLYHKNTSMLGSKVNCRAPTPF